MRGTPVDPVGFRLQGGLNRGIKGWLKRRDQGGGKGSAGGVVKGDLRILGLRWRLRDGSRREGKGIGFRGD